MTRTAANYEAPREPLANDANEHASFLRTAMRRIFRSKGRTTLLLMSSNDGSRTPDTREFADDETKNYIGNPRDDEELDLNGRDKSQEAGGF
ncbi:hypothetical protein PG988_002937 [Apiospora saccharicola]